MIFYFFLESNLLGMPRSSNMIMKFLHKYPICLYRYLKILGLSPKEKCRFYFSIVGYCKHILNKIGNMQRKTHINKENLP